MGARRGLGWAAAAALVAAAALAKMGVGHVAEPAGDPAVEARVLVRTIESFEARWAREPGNPVIGAGLADRHLMMFRLDNDLRHLERAETIAVALAPLALDRAGALATLSAARLSRHDFVGAWSSAEEALSANDRHAGALGAAFDAAVATGRYDRAEEALRALETHHQGSMAQRIRTARWLGATGETERALAVLETTCARLRSRAVPRQTMAWCESIRAGLELGSVGAGAARRRFERVLELQPGYTAGVEGLANLAYAAGDWRRAKRLYERILSDTHPDIYLRVADVERALGDVDASRSAERRFVELAGRPSAEALNAHPLAIYLASRPATRDEALAVIERDLARRPSVETWEVAAWVRLSRHEPKEALAASDASRTWGVPTATGDYVRGRILRMLGRTDEGTRLMDEATARRAELAPHVLQDIGP